MPPRDSAKIWVASRDGLEWQHLVILAERILGKDDDYEYI